MDTETIVLNAFSAYMNNEALNLPEELSDGDFSAFIKKSMLHKILPMTGTALLKSGFLSDGKTAVLKKAVKQQAIGQARRSHEFLRVYRELTATGAKPLCVKGITCRVLYPEPDMRLSGDEDLLASEEDFDLCAAKLTELGFIAGSNDRDFEAAFTNPVTGCRIELHRSFFSPENEFFTVFNSFFTDIFKKAYVLTIDGTNIYMPSDDDHFLYLVLHAFKHFVQTGIGIRQICDIAVFYRTHVIDMAAVFEKCAEVNADVFLNAVLLAGEKYFGADIKNIKSVYADFDHELDIEPLLNDIMSGAVYGADTAERAHTATITTNAVTAATKEGNSSVLRSVFPSRHELKNRYKYLEKYPVLLPVAWAQRIVKYAASGSKTSETVKLGEQRIELLKQYRVIK